MGIEYKSILVVEDSDAVRLLLSDLLQGAGANVTQCSDGKAAICMLAHSEFDLVVTDVLLPNEDGVAVIRTSKAGKKPTPVLAISGGGAQYSAHWLLKITQAMGADAILHKPFEPDDFLAAVQRLT